MIAKGVRWWAVVGRAVLIEVLVASAPRLHLSARAPCMAGAHAVSHFACSISLPSDAAPFRIPDHHGGDGFCPEKYNIRYHVSANTSQALHYVAGRYLQPGESTQVGAVLDVDVGGATAAAAVGVLGSLRHGGHCRWFVSRSAVGATLPVGHRSTSESGCGRRARTSRGASPPAPLPRLPRTAPPRGRTSLQGGRPAGARGSCYHPRAPPSQPFIDTPVLTPSRFSFICFAQKFGETLHVLYSGNAVQRRSAVISGDMTLVVNKWSRGRGGQIQPLPVGFLSVPGRRPRPAKCRID